MPKRGRCFCCIGTPNMIRRAYRISVRAASDTGQGPPPQHTPQEELQPCNIFERHLATVEQNHLDAKAYAI